MAKYQEKLLKQDININSSGDQVIITPGSGEMPAAWENPAECIVIDHINLLTAGGTTLQFKDGKSGDVSPVVYGGQYTLASGQAMVLENSFQNDQDGVIRLRPNHSLVITLGSSVQVSGFIRYRLLHAN